MKKKKRNQKSILRFLPFLFIILMVISLLPGFSKSPLLSPSIGGPQTQSASFFALFMSVSFIISMLIIFIIYYVISKEIY